MNFFEHQDKARKKTALLVLYFFLAMVIIILFIDLIICAALIYASPYDYTIPSEFTHQLNQEAVIELFLTTTLIVSPIVVMVLVIGSIAKTLALRQGGLAVADMVGATPISPDTSDFQEKRFINVVEEMSIASGIPIPKLYVMKNETAINAFVSGFKPEDTVMVVTKGALDQLNRDELQGVVGHEFSHIFNSDMHISLRLMGILGGLLVIGQLGFFLIRMIGAGPSGRRSEKGGDRIVIAILIIGVGLLIIGYIGLFFGRLIKAGVSRQRELLADASSVQYTRNPEGLIHALMRIKQSEQGSYLATKHVEDISHICFCKPRWIMFSNLLATHPPLDVRINTLDPEGQYRQLPVKRIEKGYPPKDDPKARNIFMPLIASTTLEVQTDAIKQSIGNPTEDHIMHAKNIVASIPQDLQEAAHNQDTVAFIFYALLLSSDGSKMDDMLSILKKELNSEETKTTLEYYKMIKALPNIVYLPLIDISLPTFRLLSLTRRQHVFSVMQQLAAFNESLFQFTLLTLISKTVEDEKRKDIKIKFTDFNAVIPEISSLISLMLENTIKTKKAKAAIFQAIMKNFTQQSVPLPEGKDPIKLQAILFKLNLLSPLCKEKLIHALLECITEDNIVNINEAELVRAIAASLGCPIPPIIATQ